MYLSGRDTDVPGEVSEITCRGRGRLDSRQFDMFRFVYFVVVHSRITFQVHRFVLFRLAAVCCFCYSLPARTWDQEYLPTPGKDKNESSQGGHSESGRIAKSVNKHYIQASDNGQQK